MKPRTQAGRALFNRHAWRLEDAKLAAEIVAIEREAAHLRTRPLADVLTAFHLRLVGYCSESHRTDAKWFAAEYAHRTEERT